MKTMDRLRVGMVGTSWWADEMHLPSLKSHAQAEVVAIAGRDPARAGVMAQKYAIPQVFTDYRAMIARAKLHALVVSVPDDLHYPIVMDALDAGLHVLCEKPLASTGAQAKAMYQKAEAAGVRHMTYFTWRWRPQIPYVRDLIEDGFVGRVRHCQLSQVSGYARGDEYAWRLDARRANGVLGDLGSHIFDMARWFVGEISRVNARLSIVGARHGIGAEPLLPANDLASLTVEFANGAQGTLLVSAVAQVGAEGHVLHVALHGADGSLMLDYSHTGSSIQGVRAGEERFRPLPVPVSYWGAANPDQPFEVYLKEPAGPRAFVDAILADRPATPSFYDGWRAQAVIDAALESDRSGCWVDVATPEA
jgi:predicted dehydrogenase